VRVERALYLADADALLAAIRGVEDGVAELLLVAHNPGVGALAAALAGSGDAAALERLRRGYPPAALAALAFGARGWRRVREAGGELVAFRAPGDAD
jgi:phosphohistidine phosphatase